jgi:hypothetical protein
MKYARTSRRANASASLARIAFLVVLATSGAARADEHTFTIIPPDCTQYWLHTHDMPAAWDHWMSLAACTEDVTIGHIDDADQLPGLLEEFQDAQLATLQVYLAVVKTGPEDMKIRAGFQMAMTQVTLMTRMRASIRAPADLWTNPVAAARYERLHRELEPLLEEPALLAWTLFRAIDVAVADRPKLARDLVTKRMVRRAREHARELERSWRFPYRFEPPPVFAR